MSGIGSPGGDTIPNSVAQVLRNLVDHQMSIDQAIEHAELQQNGLLQALSRERAARLYHATGRARIAEQFMEAAIDRWMRHGVVVRVQRLVESVEQRFLHADRRPHVAIREDGVDVKIDDERAVAVDIRELDEAGLGSNPACKCGGGHER